MSVRVFKDQRVWTGPVALSTHISVTNLQYGAEPQDATALGSTTRERVGGLKFIALSHEGYWGAGSSGPDGVLFDRIGDADIPVTIAAIGSSEGGPAYLFEALHSEYTLGGTVGELMSYGVTAEADSDLVRGIIARNQSTLGSSNSTGTAFEIAASSSLKTLTAALHVLSVSTAGSTEALVMTIESAATSGSTSWTTRITFTATTASTGELKTAAGTTDTWFRAHATSPTSSGKFSVVVSLGVSTN